MGRNFPGNLRVVYGDRSLRRGLDWHCGCLLLESHLCVWVRYPDALARRAPWEAHIWIAGAMCFRVLRVVAFRDTPERRSIRLRWATPSTHRD